MNYKDLLGYGVDKAKATANDLIGGFLNPSDPPPTSAGQIAAGFGNIPPSAEIKFVGAVAPKVLGEVEKMSPALKKIKLEQLRESGQYIKNFIDRMGDSPDTLPQKKTYINALEQLLGVQQDLWKK